MATSWAGYNTTMMRTDLDKVLGCPLHRTLNDNYPRGGITRGFHPWGSLRVRFRRLS